MFDSGQDPVLSFWFGYLENISWAYDRMRSGLPEGEKLYGENVSGTERFIQAWKEADERAHELYVDGKMDPEDPDTNAKIYAEAVSLVEEILDHEENSLDHELSFRKFWNTYDTDSKLPFLLGHYGLNGGRSDEVPLENLAAQYFDNADNIIPEIDNEVRNADDFKDI